MVAFSCWFSPPARTGAWSASAFPPPTWKKGRPVRRRLRPSLFPGWVGLPWDPSFLLPPVLIGVVPSLSADVPAHEEVYPAIRSSRAQDSPSPGAPAENMLSVQTFTGERSASVHSTTRAGLIPAHGRARTRPHFAQISSGESAGGGWILQKNGFSAAFSSPGPGNRSSAGPAVAAWSARCPAATDR